MKKNVASQSIGVQMITAADGTAFTGATTVYVTGDAGTQAIGSVGSGACAHEGNGFHTYAPAQAETNYDHIAFTFIGTGAIPVTVQLYTEFPQTGDAFARLGAPAGASIAADLVVIDNFVDDLEGRLTATRAGYLDNLSAGAAALEATAQSILTDTGTTLETHLTDIKGATFSGTTDSLEAIRDRGDAAWTTATGFSTHTAADVWTVGTRALTDKAGFSLSAAGVDAIHDEVVENTLTWRQLSRLLYSANAGKAAGGGTATITFRDHADTKDRITATTDASGNRTAVTLDVS